MRLTDAREGDVDGARRPRQGRRRWTCWCATARRSAPSGWSRPTTSPAPSTPRRRRCANWSKKGFDAVYSELNLDSARDGRDPARCAANTCQLITGIDNDNWRIQGIPDELAEQQKQRREAIFGARGINMFATCTPYQVGNVPVKGEHCAWMESSAVIYCNSVLGARTNTEGKELHRRRRADRPHPLLGLSHPGEPPRHPPRRGRYRGRRHHGLGPARLFLGEIVRGGHPGPDRQLHSSRA